MSERHNTLRELVHAALIIEGEQEAKYLKDQRCSNIIASIEKEIGMPLEDILITHE